MNALGTCHRGSWIHRPEARKRFKLQTQAGIQVAAEKDDTFLKRSKEERAAKDRTARRQNGVSGRDSQQGAVPLRRPRPTGLPRQPVPLET